MARTLVIPDADFSTHKIETVSFDPAPADVPVSWAWKVSKVSDPLLLYDVASSANIYKYITGFGYQESASEHAIASVTSDYVPSPYAIKVPTGKTKVKVSATDYSLFLDGTGARICWAKDVDSGASGEHRTKIKDISRQDFNNGELPIEFDVPEGADAFIITLRFTNDQTSYVTADAVAEHIGLKIEFL